MNREDVIGFLNQYCKPDSEDPLHHGAQSVKKRIRMVNLQKVSSRFGKTVENKTTGQHSFQR